MWIDRVASWSQRSSTPPASRAVGSRAKPPPRTLTSRSTTDRCCGRSMALFRRVAPPTSRGSMEARASSAGARSTTSSPRCRPHTASKRDRKAAMFCSSSSAWSPARRTTSPIARLLVWLGWRPNAAFKSCATRTAAHGAKSGTAASSCWGPIRGGRRWPTPRTTTCMHPHIHPRYSARRCSGWRSGRTTTITAAT